MDSAAEADGTADAQPEEAPDVRQKENAAPQAAKDGQEALTAAINPATPLSVSTSELAKVDASEEAGQDESAPVAKARASVVALKSDDRGRQASAAATDGARPEAQAKSAQATPQAQAEATQSSTERAQAAASSVERQPTPETLSAPTDLKASTGDSPSASGKEASILPDAQAPAAEPDSSDPRPARVNAAVAVRDEAQGSQGQGDPFHAALDRALGGEDAGQGDEHKLAADKRPMEPALTGAQAMLRHEATQSAGKQPVAAAAPAPTPEAAFAEANHSRIVTSVKGELLPHGGAMQIRLDPPELGALQVSVEMRDGALTASFQTSNDEATRLLSHSLEQLKTALEMQGVSVEKLRVQQAPRQEFSQPNEDSPNHQSQDQEQSARQEQQRREMMQRLWRRLSGGKDPLDLVA